jgi:hypothetical protein
MKGQARRFNQSLVQTRPASAGGMSKGVPPACHLCSIHDVAKYFGVDPCTVRRWILKGCPCVRRGSRGPGRGAVLDLIAVIAWRSRAIAPTGFTADEVVQRIAQALWDSLENDHADLRAGISREEMSAALLVAWERLTSTFGQTFKWDAQPEPIRALMREL